MTAHRIPICLADGSVVYSEEIGTVQFTPVVNGQEMVPLEFTNVLYVPSLSSNLFSQGPCHGQALVSTPSLPTISGGQACTPAVGSFSHDCCCSWDCH